MLIWDVWLSCFLFDMCVRYLDEDVTVKNFLSLDKDSFDAYKEQEEEDRSQLMLKCPGLAEWESFLETLKQNRNSEAALGAFPAYEFICGDVFDSRLLPGHAHHTFVDVPYIFTRPLMRDTVLKRTAGTVKAEFDTQVSNITRVLFATNDAHTGTERLLSSAERFSQAIQALVELNGEFDSNIGAGFGPRDAVNELKASLNGASRIAQHAAKAVHEASSIRMSFANSFALLGACAKRDRLTMLTFIDILKRRENLRKKHEVRRLLCAQMGLSQAGDVCTPDVAD